MIEKINMVDLVFDALKDEEASFNCISLANLKREYLKSF